MSQIIAVKVWPQDLDRVLSSINSMKDDPRGRCEVLSARAHQSHNGELAGEFYIILMKAYGQKAIIEDVMNISGVFK